MNYELTVRVANDIRTVFLQEGFFSDSAPTPHLHEHTYTEVHIIHGGKCSFAIGGKVYEVCAGELIAIPAHTMHTCLSFGEGAKHAAFQIKVKLPRIMLCTADSDVLDCFFSQINESEKTREFSKISAYISLLCSDLLSADVRMGNPITDYAFIIHEFFSNRYVHEVTLSDLAYELHLSEKQTDRLVQRYTGNTFRKELARQRISVAKHLESTTDMSLSEISRYVGYRSYSGFWKAYRKNSGE